MASQDAEFILPISLLKSMNDLPQNLMPLENFPNIFQFDIENQHFMLKTFPVDDLNLRDKLFKISQFFNEAVIQSSIPHPNILPINGIVLTNNNILRPGIITKACKYDNLRTFIDKNSHDPTSKKMLDANIKTFFSLAIIDAISELHDRNLIHGDIKPDNIFIDADEKLTFRPYLADFESSRLLSEYNVLSGTRFYQSPEILICQNNPGCDMEVGFPSDIFSFGMTMLNMEKEEPDLLKIFGLPDDPNITNDEILQAYLTIPEISNHNDPINEIIINCCNIPPDDRPKAKQVFEKIKSGQFFSGTNKEKITEMMEIEEQLKNDLKTKMSNKDKKIRYSTLTESQEIFFDFPTITHIQFIGVLVYLLGLISYEDIMDEISKSIINRFQSSKIKDTGLQILELTCNIFKIAPAVDQIQLLISEANRYIYLSSTSSMCKIETKPIQKPSLIKKK